MSSIIIQEHVDEKCVQIKLNRPEILNALSVEMITELQKTYSEIADNDRIASVIVSSSHPYVFCGGADSNSLIHKFGREESQRFIAQMEELFWQMTTFPKPIIGAINGYAIGGGAQLAATFDIRVGNYSTSFQFAGCTYGLVVGSWQLASIVGPSRAMELMITARKVEATEAEKMGLLHYLSDGSQLEHHALKIAKLIAKNDPVGVTAAKKLSFQAYGASLEESYSKEVQYNIQNIGTENFKMRLGKTVEQRKNRR